MLRCILRLTWRKADYKGCLKSGVVSKRPGPFPPTLLWCSQPMPAKKQRVLLRIWVQDIQRPVYPSQFIEYTLPSCGRGTEILPSNQGPWITSYISWRVNRKRELDVPIAFWHTEVLQVRDRDARFSGSFSWPWEVQKTQQPCTITGGRYLFIACSAQEGGLSCL